LLLGPSSNPVAGKSSCPNETRKTSRCPPVRIYLKDGKTPPTNKGKEKKAALRSIKIVTLYNINIYL
jgi:hypothetical protein